MTGGESLPKWGSPVMVMREWKAGDRGRLRVEVRLKPLRFWPLVDRRFLWLKRRHPKHPAMRQRVLMVEIGGRKS